jgi:1-acyl-sn-glycerol-3-phosphate acyltransferase
MFDPVKHSLQNTLDFKPPQPNSMVQEAFRLILPLICNKILGGLSVHIADSSLQKLQALQGQRCLLLPNHPSEWDPCVLFDIGKRLKENFYFVAAREVFDYSYGLRGWFFQKLGVYSLVRGSNDRKSLKTSMEILSENKGRLVIFVEGEISQQNETLLPLEAGVIQLAFMALNDVYKQGGKNLDALPSLYVCPVSLRYAFQQEGLTQAIEMALDQLEQATCTEKKGSSFERLCTLAATVLEHAAAQIGYPLNPALSMAENVGGLSNQMLTKLEHLINLSSQAELSYLDRVRSIRNKTDAVLTHAEEASSSYQERLHAQQKTVLKNYYQNLDRIVNFVAIYDGYLQPDMDAARYVELIRRLEKEVFGASRLLPPRTAHVEISDPVDLKPYFADFMDDKRATVQKLAQDIERKLYTGIQLAKPACQPSIV